MALAKKGRGVEGMKAVVLGGALSAFTACCTKRPRALEAVEDTTEPLPTVPTEISVSQPVLPRIEDSSDYEDLSDLRRSLLFEVGGIPAPPPQPASLSPNPGAWRDSYRPASPAHSETANGIPSALASAFAKDKKPFTYFSGGVPDLSEGKPSQVRRAESQTPTRSLGRPKVLPLLPDMQHLQYNTPLPLYSSSAAKEAVNMQSGGENTTSSYSANQSATYKHVHESQNRASHGQQHGQQHGHSAQSPSFRSLQFLANEGTEDLLQDTGVHKPREGHVYSPARDMHPAGLAQGERQSRVSAQRQTEHMRAAQEEADWRAGNLQATQRYFDDRPKHYPTGAEVAPNWRGAAEKTTQRAIQVDDAPKHYPTGAEVHPDWDRKSGGLDFNDRPKHYPTGSEVAPDWQDRSVEQQHRARSQGLEHQPKHYATGAEVEAEWRDRSIAKTARNPAIQTFDYSPKKYRAGAEVEADWRVGGLREGFDYHPKHYAAGAEVTAAWADKALGKTRRWESWGHSLNDTQARHYAAGQEVRADWEDRSATKASKWDDQYSAYHGTSNNEELFQPQNVTQPPPPRPDPGLQVHVEVDRGGVLYSPGASPRYRSRSQEADSRRSHSRATSAKRQTQHTEMDHRYLHQAHAHNLNSVHGGRDGPAPILTLHQVDNLTGRPTDVKDQGTYFGPTAGRQSGRSSSHGERFGAAAQAFTGPHPGTRQYWDEMGGLDFHGGRRSQSHSTTRVDRESSSRQAAEWRREMEITRAREASAHREQQEQESRYRQERSTSEQRRTEARWKAEAYRRQEEDNQRREESLRASRARSEAMEHEEEQRRRRAETMTRTEQDSKLRAEQEALEKIKRQEALHREQQRIDEEYRLAERERQKRQMGTDFLYLSQKGAPREYSRTKQSVSGRSQSSHSFRSTSAHREQSTASSIAREEKPQVAREEPSWAKTAASKTKSAHYASSGDLQESRSRATTPGSIYALDGGMGVHVEYDDRKMKTVTRSANSARSFNANQVQTHSTVEAPPKPIALPSPISPRPYSAGSGTYERSAYHKTVSSSSGEEKAVAMPAPASPRSPAGGSIQQMASFTQSTTSSSTGLRHEEDARRQREAMEAELRTRAASSSTNQNAVTTYSSGPVVTSYSVNAGDANQWQKTGAGASTKASTSGDFLDASGNKVSYVKEMYTSSDPGKEFSMLTQEEKKVMEAPVEPGVISRHVTTKYYKKSTYTSSSTTGTTPSQPAIAHSGFGPGSSATTRVVRSPAPLY